MDKIVVGVVAGGTGFCLGIVLAMLCGGSLAKVTAQRDVITIERDEALAEVQRLSAVDAQRAEAAGDVERLTGEKAELHEELKAAAGKMVELLVAIDILQEALQQAEVENAELGVMARPWTKPAKKTPAGDWKAIKQWTINGSKTTAVFHVSSSPWRVSWETTGRASVFVSNQEGFVGVASSSGSSSTIIHAGPGDYHLSLTSIDRATFWVEERR